jgi:hypothetical protein
MTDNRRDDSHLDAAIDRAVRDLMSVEPRAGLRERVLAELTGEPVRAAWWPRLALGSAAIAVVVAVVLMIGSRPPQRPVDRTIAGATPPTTATQNTAETAKPPEATPPVHVDGPRAQAATRSPVVEDRLVQAASDRYRTDGSRRAARAHRSDPHRPDRNAGRAGHQHQANNDRTY